MLIPPLVVKWKSLGTWPLPCQMVFVLKPLTQSQQTGDDVQADYKHKSRLVICGNFAAWGAHSTTTTNLDAPLLQLMPEERDQKIRDLEFMYKDKLAHLVQSHIHPSLWFIAEGPLVLHQWIPPFDHSLRSDAWTAQLHDHQILGYVGVYVDDLLIAGPRSLHDSLINAVQNV